MENSVDITPTPKILRTLGDIPFEIWQCIAELSDNSIDAFKSAEASGFSIEDPKINVYWSSENTPQSDREITIEDNALGMDLETLQKAAKAGFSSNDPVGNLGLFGMGFNIATARLGDETIFLSTKSGDPCWRGIRINFDELIKSHGFSAPTVEVKKDDVSQSGTKIIIRKLKNGIHQDIKVKNRTIKKRLESIYTPILESKKISFYLGGKKLDPSPHCIWDKSRFVVRKNEKISCYQEIDRDLGDTYFDVSKNRYLSEDECFDIDNNQGVLPEHHVKRARRLKGWIGIQRYADPSDFGIDFIRNGRKILVSNKELFSYESDETGVSSPEYPVDLGSTVGGRIVGELHVDYLIPTYQKNAFDKTDMAWRLTVEAVRGAGPILPGRRSAHGYDGENVSPLGLLINAYRRTDPGTKSLAIPNSTAKDWSKLYYQGNSAFLTDEKWYKAAQDADREKGEGGGNSTPVNQGDDPTDSVGDYLDLENNAQEASPKIVGGVVTATTEQLVLPLTKNNTTSSRNELIENSTKDVTLTGNYSYSTRPGFEVSVWKVANVQIRVSGIRLPVLMLQDGIDVDYFYDPSHPLLAEYPISPKQLLLQLLAEKFSTRDTGVSILSAFFGLIDNHLIEERINTNSMQERSESVFNSIRERLPDLLSDRVERCFELIKKLPLEERYLGEKLLEDAPSLIEDYSTISNNSSKVLRYVGQKMIIEFIKEFPECFFDKKLFDVPYTGISGFQDIETLRALALEKVVNYLKDVSIFMLSSKLKKNELMRMSNTLSIIESQIV